MKVRNLTHGQFTMEFDTTSDPHGVLVIKDVDPTEAPQASVVVKPIDQTNSSPTNEVALWPNNSANALDLAQKLYGALADRNPASVTGPTPV